MPITISGSTGIAGVDGSASTPAVQGTDTNTGIAFPAADTIAWTTGGTERMRVDSSGNVGIGTTPSQKLQVAGNVMVGTASAGAALMLQNATTYWTLEQSTSSFLIANTGTERMRIDSSGNVGIGTSSPGRRLDIEQSGTDYQLRIGDAGSNYYDIGRNTTNGLLTFNGNQTVASGYVFSTVNGERARIDTSGRLGVGTSSPDTNFLVTFSSSNGALAANTTGTSDGIAMNLNTGGTAGQSVYAIPVRTAGTLRGGIQWNGTNLLYNNTSDYRLKTNVAPMRGALNRISLLNPCTYTWIEQQISGEGFIAHELQSVIPAAVTGEKDAVNEDGNPIHQGVDYSKIVVHLVAAIQELKAENDDLKARLTALEAK